MKASTLIRHILDYRRKLFSSRHASAEMKRVYDKYVTVEVKDTGGRYWKIKSVKLRDTGHFTTAPTIEITLTDQR